MLALVVLVGLAGGVVLMTVAGARRSSTAYDRFRSEALASDLDISPSDPDPERLEQVEQLPQIKAFARTAFPFIRPKGSDLYPFLDFLVVVGPDGRIGAVVDRPRMVAGRMPDPDEAGEFAVSKRLATEADLVLGDRVTFESYAPDQFEALFGSGEPIEPSGPVVTLTVTGVFNHPEELSESLGDFEVRAFLTPAFYAEHDGRIGAYERGGSARLIGGERDVAAVSKAVRQIYRDDPELELEPAAEGDRKIEDSIQVLVTALLLCSVSAAIAGMVAVGQALARHLSGSAVDESSLAGIGMGRRQRLGALALSAFPVAIGGALLAGLVAVAASPLMPVGVARRADPDPGLSVDGLVLSIGLLATAVIVGILTLAAGWRASKAGGEAPAPSSGNRVSVLRVLTTASLPPSATTGARMALEQGRGRSAVPVRSAMVGATLGVTGLVAVTVFGASLAGLVDTPARYGAPWDAVVVGFGGDVVEEHGEALVADSKVRDLGTVTSSLGQIGDEDVNTYAFESLKGSADPTLLEGRMPARSNEVVLGSATLRDLDAEVDDTVQLTGPEGPVRLSVVGRAAFPLLDERARVNRGAALTEDGLNGVATPESLNIDLLVTWASGVDEAAANRELEDRTGAQVAPPRLPPDVNNLKLVDALPRALAAFLAALAVVAVLHALMTSAHRRRRDFAVLRTLGFVRGQLSATMAWQASTFAVVGLIIGVPLGIAAGRVAWSAVSTSLGVVDRSAVRPLVIGLVVAGSLVVANLAARLPARLVGKVRPAVALRTG